MQMRQPTKSCSSFKSGGVTKHMTGPSTSMFSSPSPRGTLRVSGKQNSLFPLGPVIKCLLSSIHFFNRNVSNIALDTNKDFLILIAFLLLLLARHWDGRNVSDELPHKR